MSKQNVPKSESSIKRKANIRGRALELLKFGRNMSQHFLDAYFLDDLIEQKIHNDLGASFTYTHRKGSRITKAAKPKGEAKLRDEINWYLLLQQREFSKYLPQIYRYSLKKGAVFLEMKYYTYPNLRKIIFNDMNARFFIKMRLKHLFDALIKNLYIKENSRPAPEDFVEKSHFSKLKNRIAETMEMAPFLREVITSKFITVNGRSYVNVLPIIPALEKNSKIMQLLKPETVYYAHGDLHSNNILCGIMHSDLILLDCRGRSPYGDLYFDVAYDVAKLYHDFHSLYSLIENRDYSIFLNGTGRKINIEFEFTNDEVKKRFEYWGKYLDILVKEKLGTFGNLEYRAKFTEAILYLTMVPFHLKRNSEGLMCYAIGIIRLNEWLERYHNDFYKALIKKTRVKTQ